MAKRIGNVLGNLAREKGVKMGLLFRQLSIRLGSCVLFHLTRVSKCNKLILLYDLNVNTCTCNLLSFIHKLVSTTCTLVFDYCLYLASLNIRLQSLI
jgi:hypothetical protein